MGKESLRGFAVSIRNTQAAGMTLYLLERTNWPAMSGGRGHAAQPLQLETASEGRAVTLIWSSAPSDLHLYRSLEKFYTKQNLFY